MVNQIFDEIVNEARNKEVILKEENIDRPIRIGFNVVDKDISQDLPNFYIQNKDNFYNLLNKYVYLALKFYNLNTSYNNIKKVLTFIWSNISTEEMSSIELYLYKYINFIKDTIFYNINGQKETSIGTLKYKISKQSIEQETPYCFKSYFEKYIDGNIARYALPRISFGISDGICYIYAIQNKDSKINTNPKYNLEIKDTINKINSGVKKYRNVTPSFVVALSLFISCVNKEGISKIKVESPLPIRKNNRELVTEYKIKFETMKGILSGETLENFKSELINKKLNDEYNSTIKFVNCINRLKVHFDNIYLSSNIIDEGLIVEIMNLYTNNSFLAEIVKNNIDEREERYNGKIS